jgi:hypothetical protein
VTEHVQVEAARIPDRDKLLETLRGNGLDARPEGEIGIEVPLADDADVDDEVFVQVERLVLELGAPFVPMKHDGVIYIRPPLG